MDDWSSAKLGDVANLILGMILFFSPWLFGLSAGAQWQTASIIGIFIAVSSIAALAASAVWEEWVNLGAGLTLIVSPWLLGFQDSSAMAIRPGDRRHRGTAGGHRRVARGRRCTASQDEPEPVGGCASALDRRCLRREPPGCHGRTGSGHSFLFCWS